MATYPSPAHPLGPPSISATDLTVDLALQQPTRITRTIEDLTLQKFLVDKVFTNGGSVSGGAVLYDIAEENELYLSREVEPIAPAGEYPIVSGARRTPSIAAVEKWGGKMFITDEARDRNEAAVFARELRQLGNTIVRRINTNTMTILDAAVTAYSRTMEGTDWSAVKTAGSEASTASKWPLADLAHVNAQAEIDEKGIEFNLLILNPQEYQRAVTIYGGNGGFQKILSDMGYSYYVSNRQTAGKAKVVAAGQVGQYRVEQPIQTVTYRSGDGEDTDRTWVKSSVRPVEFVDNPYAIIELTKLAG
jgi:hypothetical protein